MRISDWSSDVCSSDLVCGNAHRDGVRTVSTGLNWCAMARLSDAFLDDLLARTDIVEVIGARVEIKRAGREYSGRCPFHDERSPSSTVSPSRSEEHTSELQSLMRISYAVFFLKKKT